MKKIINSLMLIALCTAFAFAQEESSFDDSFSIDLDLDLSDAISEEAPAEGNGKMANVLQGLWIEATSDTNAIIRDIATGEKSGYEIDSNHFKSNANWWFWGDINKTFHLDAEIGVWDFDKTMYQANSFAGNVPDVTVGDGLQSLAAMLFSPISNGNDDGVGALNKLGFTISSPYLNLKFGYGNLQGNGMAEYTGIYNVLDRWLDVGKGFTEISNGKKLQKFGDVKINALAAFSMMRGTYGMYDFVEAKFGENYKAAVTFGSKTNEEQLFYYNQNNINAASAYFCADPWDFMKLEAHVLGTFGTEVNFSNNAMAYAGRVTFKNEKFNLAVKGSYAGEDVNSVWGSDGQAYDDINADTITGKVDLNYDVTDYLTLILDETCTLNDVDALGEGEIVIRNQPVIDFDLNPLAGIDLKTSLYGVVNVDRPDSTADSDQKCEVSFEEAGIEITAANIAQRLKKIVFDYGISLDSDVTYHSFMLNTDVTDKLNLHAGAIIRWDEAADADFVPFGFAFGAKLASIPLPGNPMLWAHFCYGMNPYSENNYSLYRADNWMNKAVHRTYLLDDLYEDYTTSQISIGLIWNLQ